MLHVYKMGADNSQELGPEHTFPNRHYLPLYDKVTAKSWEYIKDDPKCVELVNTRFGLKYILQVLDEMLGIGKADERMITYNGSFLHGSFAFDARKKGHIRSLLSEAALIVDHGLSTSPEITPLMIPKIFVLVATKYGGTPMDIIDADKDTTALFTRNYFEK